MSALVSTEDRHPAHRHRRLTRRPGCCASSREAARDRRPAPRPPGPRRRDRRLLVLRAVTGRGRVLVVDDERHVRGMLRDLVEHLGYDASTAASGELAIVAMAAEQPDIVLLDLVMPGMSGLEVLAYFRRHYPAVPVILISGSMTEEIERQARARGAFSIVGKPFDLDTLRDVVAAAIRSVSGG